MYLPGGPADVIVHVVTAARRRRSPDETPDQTVQTYDALVFSHLPLPVQPPPATSAYPPQMRNLPLAGVERVTISATDYQSYLAGFLTGDKGILQMRQRLLEAMSPGLAQLLTMPRNMCVWWSHAAHELDDLPWELTVNAGQQSGHRLVFVRGVPPETPIPTIPVTDHPRLAVIGAPQPRPAWLAAIEPAFAQHLSIFDLPVRQGLDQAIAAGIEFVHLFADGEVSGALEGILYDHNSQGERPDLSSGELSRLLLDSRVVLLALSRSDSPNPDTQIMAGSTVLSAFRAFSYLGASTLPLPSIVTPLGPVADDLIARFWQQFYQELHDSWHLTESLRRALEQFSVCLPIALFCRHAGGRLFRRSDATAAAGVGPFALRQDLMLSERLTRDLSVLNAKYGQLPDSVQQLLHQETERQASLRGDLDPWLAAEEKL